MISVFKFASMPALLCALAAAAAAQTPTPAPAAPAAIAPPPAAAAETDAAPGKRHAKDAGTAQSEAGEPRADTSGAPAAARTAARPAARPRAPAPGAPGQKSANGVDRLELGTATVTGDREQPKVMYIVPWKKSDIGDLASKPMNSLVDEILAPVDRDVFKREVVYYRAVQADASQNGASARPSPQGEK